jgi:peptidoglycan/xylan/chitin deacetylase (PgdA/CDA1 family)
MEYPPVVISNAGADTLQRGAFCISIDLELAWGVWDVLTPEYIENCLQLERGIVARLVALLECYDISVTWAIVGGLLKIRSDVQESEIPAWFAPDIIAAIRDAKTPQEIGSHSFAHVYFSESGEEAARSDLASAKQVHRENRLQFTSFVFPRNLVNHADLLLGAGLKVFRSVDQGWHIRIAEINRTFGRIANLLDKMLPFTPTVVRPVLHGDTRLVELPSSMLLMGRNGLRRFIHPSIIAYKAKRGLHAAIRKKSLFHLWFHPSNFYYDAERQFSALEAILKEAAILRKSGRLDIRTMGSFAHV